MLVVGSNRRKITEIFKLMLIDGFTVLNIYQTQIITAIKLGMRWGRHRKYEKYMQKFSQEALMQDTAWETEALRC
jgi:hypothetical protein